MKLNKILLSTAIVAAFATTSVNAASDGVINFNGEILDKTCDITINGGASPATVNLPAVRQSLLAAAGATAGRTGFNIELANCTGSASITKAAAFFESGPTVNSTTHRLINTLTGTTAATNVELQLIDASNNSVIQVGNSSQTAGTTQVNLVSDAAILPYAVEYYATGATTAGLVTSSVNFVINYQ